MTQDEGKDDAPTLNTAKHLAYHKRCLQLLPTQFQSNDLNRMSLAFFTLNALDIFNALETTSTLNERQQWIDWVYSCQLDTGGFRGSTGTMVGPGRYSLYDSLTLPSTYFAIALLAILGDDLKRVNRKGALDALRKAQYEDGSFAPVLLGEERVGEVDVRHTYCASAARYMLSPIEDGEDIDVAAAVKYIRSCKGYDGAYSQSPCTESHAGSTYCSIAALSLLGAIDSENHEDTVHWLINRQVSSDEEDQDGGFNGRVNKPSDTCYSFWAGGALDILGALEHTSFEANRNYLLTQTQNPQLGGFGKTAVSYPDPLHSCLGLASLALNGERDLAPFDAALCVTNRVKERLANAPWR